MFIKWMRGGRGAAFGWSAAIADLRARSAFTRPSLGQFLRNESVNPNAQAPADARLAKKSPLSRGCFRPAICVPRSALRLVARPPPVRGRLIGDARVMRAIG